MQTVIDQFRTVIETAVGSNTPLQIQGGGSKRFYGNPAATDHYIVLDTKPYAGIVDYEPTELVITARAGTRLADLETALSQHGQMLAFEPPYFDGPATLGGCIAAGLSGPRRAAAGAARDFVLGVRMLNGKAEDLSFGGQVMKNVAGYDVSRLMTGSMGTLGLLLEISLKVLPKPQSEMTVRMTLSETQAIEKMNQYAGKPLPVSATCFADGELLIRLSGAESAVRAAQTKLGGELLENSGGFWPSIRDQAHPFFNVDQPLWRLSLPSVTPPVSLPGKQLLEWNGGLRWLVCDDSVSAETIRQRAKDAGGHATLFRRTVSTNSVTAFHPLDSGLMSIHRALKEKFDPAGIFNPGRLYPEL